MHILPNTEEYNDFSTVIQLFDETNIVIWWQTYYKFVINYNVKSMLSYTSQFEEALNGYIRKSNN